jgi:hypothetical protein
MRALKGVVPIAVSIGLILAVSTILWRLTLTTESSDALVYIYLFPVALIAALYNGRLALLSAAGGTNYGFEQCMATASGLGSNCQPNTQYVPPLGPHSTLRVQRRYPH